MIHLADVSEFQQVNWNVYKTWSNAAIIRALYGTHHIDGEWEYNRGNAGILRVRGIYHYLVKDQDALAQAEAYCKLIGSLRTGEFAILDMEEGDGDEVARAQTWLNYVDKTLNTHAWLYSYGPFVDAHLQKLTPFSGRRFWLASYQSHEPTDHAHNLWQHTDGIAGHGDNHPIPGVRQVHCDCSIFNGSAEDLYNLITTKITKEEAMARVPNAVGAALSPSGNGVWVADSNGGIFTFGDAQFHGSLGATHLSAPIVDILAHTDGYWLLGADGGVFAFGGAPFKGSYGTLPAEDRQGERGFLTLVSDGADGYIILGDDGSHYRF